MVWRKVLRGKETDSIVFNNIELKKNKKEETSDFSEKGDVKKRLEKQLKAEREMKKLAEKNIRINETAEIIADNDLKALHYDRLSIHIYEDEVNTVLRIAQKMIEEKNDDFKENSDTDYIWVEGYKGTDSLMQCRDEQFELNKEFTIEGDPVLCEHGYHFCLNLQDVFSYYGLSDRSILNRYFKVKCLVKKQDYIKSKIGSLNLADDSYYYVSKGMDFPQKNRYKISMDRQNKLVAKSIVFMEELGFEELERSFKANGVAIKNEETYLKIRKNNITPFENFMIEQRERLEKYISPTLAMVITDELEQKYYKLDENRYKNRDYMYNIEGGVSKLIGMLESGVSMDMAMYLFVKTM